MKKRKVIVNDLMQKNYVYYLTQPEGENFAPDFNPELSPKQMLKLGVFGGKYMTDCRKEFPPDWFRKAKLCHERHDPKLNYFGINASQPLSVWVKKGWIYHEDRFCQKFYETAGGPMKWSSKTIWRQQPMETDHS